MRAHAVQRDVVLRVRFEERLTSVFASSYLPIGDELLNGRRTLRAERRRRLRLRQRGLRRKRRTMHGAHGRLGRERVEVRHAVTLIDEG